jgi:uncharacterized protein YndB with AHSA1/START domain
MTSPAPKQQYDTSAIVRASPEIVWAILADPAGYAAWNPEILSIAGRFAAGERITARVRVGGGAIRSVPMRVTAFEPKTRMEWTGGLPLGLFVGRRTFTVSPHPDGAEFRMHLSMTGPLASPILKSLGDRQPEIDGFAAGLMAQAEKTAGTAG